MVAEERPCPLGSEKKDSSSEIPKVLRDGLAGVKDALEDSKHFSSVPMNLRNAIDLIDDEGAGCVVKSSIIMLAVENVKLVSILRQAEAQQGAIRNEMENTIARLEKRHNVMGELITNGTGRIAVLEASLATLKTNFRILELQVSRHGARP